MMDPTGLTIGRLARAANVGIDTVRYYQRRALLPMPGATDSAFRIYPADRLNEIQTKIADLQRMESVLSRLIQECEAIGRTGPCPVIAALAERRPESVDGS